MSLPFKNIIFDLDGTLTDSLPGISNCFKHALASLGYDYSARSDWNWIVGPPLLESFTELLGAEAAPRAVELYRERFGEIGWRENSLYPGIAELLERLSLNAALYIATSKPQVYTERILEHFGIARFFTGVCGAEMTGARRHKDEIIKHLLDTFAIAPETALMVGDRNLDINAAHELGIEAVGVSYGFGSLAELALARADYFCRTVEELTGLLVTE